MTDGKTGITARGAIEAIETIQSKLDWLVRTSEDWELRYLRSRAAGAVFAREVFRFTQDPEGVGTDVLEKAYARFMALHAGNFGPTQACSICGAPDHSADWKHGPEEAAVKVEACGHPMYGPGDKWACVRPRGHSGTHADGGPG